MSCCGKNNEDKKAVYDDIEPCCAIRGRRCLCLPYNDPWMITAMILSIVATCISWVWWVTLIISLAGIAMFQIFWCCRNSCGTMYAAFAVALVCSLAQLGVGLYVSYAFENKMYCSAFDLETDTWQNDCYKKLWAAIAYICGILWVVVAFCVLHFVKSGRHAKWEKTYCNEITDGNGNSASVVELEQV